MWPRQVSTSRSFIKELFAFLAVLTVCLILTVYLGVTAPSQKGVTIYVAQGVFSALFALPTGVAWRSLRRAVWRQKS
jgi:hypothetical protein